jgi:hypothetical protein
MIELDRAKPASFTRKLRQLFAAMSASGSTFGPHDIHYFNGGLFADDRPSGEKGNARAVGADTTKALYTILCTTNRAKGR